LFATDRRTVSTWLRTAGVRPDYRDHDYLLQSVGRQARPRRTAGRRDVGTGRKLVGAASGARVGTGPLFKMHLGHGLAVQFNSESTAAARDDHVVPSASGLHDVLGRLDEVVDGPRVVKRGG